MRKPLSFALTFCLVGILAATGALAARDVPTRYLPASLDGRLNTLDNPVDGRTWSAWAYRNGVEYEVALSVREAGGYWSEPHLIGESDGRDQLEPTLAVDGFGNVYVAYAERSPARIMLTWLEAGSDTWATPVNLTADGVRATTPALRVVGDRLVLAFRSGRGLVMLDLPLWQPACSTNIFNDGPDPVENRDDDNGSDGGPDDDDGGIRPIGTGGSGTAPGGEEPGLDWETNN